MVQSTIAEIQRFQEAWGNFGLAIIIEEVPKTSYCAQGDNDLIDHIDGLPIQAAVYNQRIIIFERRIFPGENSFAVIQRE